MRGFFTRFGSLQFDPIAVAGRSHDLVLHARVADYEPAWCDALYEHGEIFEAVNKGLSFVAISEYPWFRAPWSRKASRVLDEHPEVAKHVLERIRVEGSLSSLDFERRRGALTDWFGAPTNVVRAVLEAYAYTGVLGLARRNGSRRYYDLLERLVPARFSGANSPSQNSCDTSCSRATAHTACSAPAAEVTSSAASARRKRPPTGRVTPVAQRCAKS